MSMNVVSRASRVIAITFDDLPQQQPIRDASSIPDVNRRLLNRLTTNQVPAIGFVNEQVFITQKDESLLETWLDAGMDLGNHTFSHADLHEVSVSEFLEEITRGERMTRRSMKDRGISLRYFRYPYLHTGTTAEMRYTVEKFLSRHGYTVAPVTVAGNEWMFTQLYDKAKFEADTDVMQYVGSQYVPYIEQCLICAEENSLLLFDREIPQIQLLHASALNADYMDELLAMMRGRGYMFVSLSCALADDVYLRAQNYIGRGGISWLERWARTMGKELKSFPREADAVVRLYMEAGL